MRGTGGLLAGVFEGGRSIVRPPGGGVPPARYAAAVNVKVGVVYGAFLLTSTSVNALPAAPLQLYEPSAALNNKIFDISVPWYTNALVFGGHENVIDLVVVVFHVSENESENVVDIPTFTTSILTSRLLVMLTLCVELNEKPCITLVSKVDVTSEPVLSKEATICKSGENRIIDAPVV